MAAPGKSQGWRGPQAAAYRRQDQGRRRTELLSPLAGPECCLLPAGVGAGGHVQDTCGSWDEDEEGDGDGACGGADYTALMSASLRGILGTALERTPLLLCYLAPIRC